jgi:hypothetical protein
MHTTVRKYNGVPNPREAGRRVHEEFVPQISQLTGFVAYYLTDAGSGTMISTSVFQDRAGADESTKKAAEWIKLNPGMFPTPAEITVGEVLAHRAR